MSCIFFQVSLRQLVQTHSLVRAFKLWIAMFQPPRFVAAFMKEQESAPAVVLGNGASPPFGPSSIIPPFTPGMGPSFAPAKAPAFPGLVHQPMPAVTAPSTSDDCFVIPEAEATKDRTVNRDLWDDEQWAFFMQILHEEFLKGNLPDKGTIRQKDLLPIVPRMQDKFTNMKTVTSQQLQTKWNNTKTKHRLLGRFLAVDTIPTAMPSCSLRSSFGKCS